MTAACEWGDGAVVGPTLLVLNSALESSSGPDRYLIWLGQVLVTAQHFDTLI